MLLGGAYRDGDPDAREVRVNYLRRWAAELRVLFGFGQKDDYTLILGIDVDEYWKGAARAVATFTEGETIDLFEPCPFCGSWLGCIVRTERYGTPPPGAQPHEGWWSFTARCGSCSAEGPPSTASEAGALERWERRA